MGLKFSVSARYFHIVGGGCFGRQYLKWLQRARSLGWLNCEGIRLIDRDPNCPAVREGELQFPDQFVEADWVDYFSIWLTENYLHETAARDHWVPSPLSPHILFLGFLRAAGRLRPRLQFHESPFEEETPTPVRIPLPAGTQAVSFAQWRCPVNCIEPPTCPAIHDTRTWDMKRTLDHFFEGRRERSAHVLQCRHLVHGVGTIPCAVILEEFHRFLKELEKGSVRELVVATVSGCHGLIGRARIALQAEAKGQDTHQEKTAR